MSYNIDTWRTKSMVDFAIPLDVVQNLPYAEVELLPDNKVSVSGISEIFELEGTLVDGDIIVEKIDYCGERSGYAWGDFLEALKHSKGSLVAIQVWEGGDRITRLVVKDGIVDEEQVEL